MLFAFGERISQSRPLRSGAVTAEIIDEFITSKRSNGLGEPVRFALPKASELLRVILLAKSLRLAAAPVPEASTWKSEDSSPNEDL